MGYDIGSSELEFYEDNTKVSNRYLERPDSNYDTDRLNVVVFEGTVRNITSETKTYLVNIYAAHYQYPGFNNNDNLWTPFKYEIKSGLTANISITLQDYVNAVAETGDLDKLDFSERKYLIIKCGDSKGVVREGPAHGHKWWSSELSYIKSTDTYYRWDYNYHLTDLDLSGKFGMCELYDRTIYDVPDLNTIDNLSNEVDDLAKLSFQGNLIEHTFDHTVESTDRVGIEYFDGEDTNQLNDNINVVFEYDKLPNKPFTGEFTLPKRRLHVGDGCKVRTYLLDLYQLDPMDSYSVHPFNLLSPWGKSYNVTYARPYLNLQYKVYSNYTDIIELPTPTVSVTISDLVNCIGDEYTLTLSATSHSSLTSNVVITRTNANTSISDNVFGEYGNNINTDVVLINKKLGKYAYMAILTNEYGVYVSEVFLDTVFCNSRTKFPIAQAQYCVEAKEEILGTLLIDYTAESELYTYSIELLTPNYKTIILQSGTSIGPVSCNIVEPVSIVGTYILRTLITDGSSKYIESAEYYAIDCGTDIDPPIIPPINNESDMILTIGDRTLLKLDNSNYTLSYSPELSKWTSVHRYRVDKYISDNLMVSPERNVSTIGRETYTSLDSQYSIIEKVIQFGRFAIVNFVKLLSDEGLPDFITVKSTRGTTERIPYVEFDTFCKYGEEEFINFLRNYTLDSEKIEYDFLNSFFPILGNNPKDDYIEGNYCIIRLEYRKKFKLFNITADGDVQDS